MRSENKTSDPGASKRFHDEAVESAWRHAWDEQAHAAQCGDYATAERWARRARMLQDRLRRALPGERLRGAPSL